MRIVAISDTHSKPHPQSLPLVEQAQPDAIFHAGDIGSLDVLKPFEKVAPLWVVRGNIDGRGDGLADSIDIEVRRDGEIIVKLLLTHIALYGPKIRADARALAREHEASMIVCGHSHVPFIGKDRGIGVLNPGSIGPRRFSLPITFGVIEVDPRAIVPRHISCETGEVWTP